MTDTKEREVLETIESAIKAWNSGATDDFMAIFNDSPNTTVITSDNHYLVGFDEIRKHYDEFIGDSTLSYDVHKCVVMNGFACVCGSYRETQVRKPSGGMFSLILWDSEEGWKVIHDHTS